VRSGRIHGSFPPRALRLVLEWAKLHRTELLANWERAAQRQPLLPIAPLE
jgi:phosphomannomutase